MNAIPPIRRSVDGRYVRLVAAAVLAFAAACSRTIVVSSSGSAESAAASQHVYPGLTWDSIPDPTAAGWRRASLDSVHEVLKPMATTGMMAIVGGRVLMSYGDLEHISYLASVRKSILAMLIGNYVVSGRMDLDKTLEELGMDDVQGLLPLEKKATVRHLFTARSGVYHPASNSGDDTQFAPQRGTQQPGTYMLYNNWDFNAAGGAFELMTGRNIYDALETDIVRPIGMQDFDRSTHRKSGNANASRYLAYHMNLSTRDMARVGYLMLRDGNWAGTQVIPREWAITIRTAVTPVTEMNPPRRRSGPWGYGYLWWVWDGPHSTGPYEGAYTGLGAVGQHIAVIPKLDLVVVHKTRTGQRNPEGGTRSVSHGEFTAVLDRLVKSYCGMNCR